MVTRILEPCPQNQPLQNQGLTTLAPPFPALAALCWCRKSLKLAPQRGAVLAPGASPSPPRLPGAFRRFRAWKSTRDPPSTRCAPPLAPFNLITASEGSVLAEATLQRYRHPSNWRPFARTDGCKPLVENSRRTLPRSPGYAPLPAPCDHTGHLWGSVPVKAARKTPCGPTPPCSSALPAFRPISLLCLRIFDIERPSVCQQIWNLQ
jgi:hypothetical protein